MMKKSNSKLYICSALPLFFLSLLAIAINFFYYQYPGNNYLPSFSLETGISLILIYRGSIIQWGKNSRAADLSNNLMIFFLVTSLIAFSTTAVQYTPFPCIDESIINIEQKLHINIKTILSFTHNHPFLDTTLCLMYSTLNYQITCIPILVLLTKHRETIHEFFFLMLFSTLIGFSFYYFFPTTAPASLIESPYFHVEQQSTGLKFMQIHNHVDPTTIDGGMISLPSFHIIWGWFCLYLLKPWPIASMLLLPINLLLAVSCVLLGWHYPMDILGSVLVILLSHAAYRYLSKASDNHPIPSYLIRTGHEEIAELPQQALSQSQAYCAQDNAL